MDGFATWSGWVFGLLGLGLAVVAEVRAHRERVESARLRTLLAKVRPAAVPQHPVGSAGERDETVRNHLIKAASRRRTLADALARSAEHGAVAEDVMRVAMALRAAGLLRFDDPLNPKTALELET